MLGSAGNIAATFFGASFLWDLDGNDEYRCGDFCLASAFGGVSVLIDESGHDHYQSAEFSQGVGIAGGYAVFMDRQGNDFYYSQSLEPSGYGDYGNFDGWSQGVGVGLRGLISGGFGLLFDGQGSDRFESGDFSQGGGYYYGWGMLINEGVENDIYQASRYGQGFTAHYALGSFIDVGGNDQYVSYHPVGQGIAWDLGISSFEDLAGNDVYRMGIMSLGAAAQSAISFAVDYQGDDVYMGMEPWPAEGKVSNEYHSGVSLGFFMDLGKGQDQYQKFKNNSQMLAPGYRWFIDR